MSFETTPFTFPFGDQRTDRGLMTYSHLLVENETDVAAVPDEDFLGLYFNLRSDLPYKIADATEGLLERRHFNLVFLPKGSCVYPLQKGSYAFLRIHFTTDYLKRFSDQIPLLDTFINKAALRVPALLAEFHAAITPDLLDSIHDIISDRFGSSPKLREMFLEAKYKGILTDALHHLYKQSSEQVQLSKTDSEKIRKAHELILKDIMYSQSVGQLADKVDLDRRVLEKGFKITFGKTVYNFLMDERMKKAHGLLRDTDLPASQIANMVGYKRLNTFSDAFRKRFGYSPRMAKNADFDMEGSDNT